MNVTFLPWLREGAAPGLPIKPTGANVISSDIDVVVQSGAGQPQHNTPVRLGVRLLGPGDVLGLDQRQVVRTDPPALGSTQPNYFPCVEFERLSLPWLFTPAEPDTDNHLPPWIVLIVVRQQDGVTIAADSGRPTPTLQITAPAVASRELPDLGESWAWAHVQVPVEPAGQDLVQLLADPPAGS